MTNPEFVLLASVIKNKPSQPSAEVHYVGLVEPQATSLKKWERAQVKCSKCRLKSDEYVKVATDLRVCCNGVNAKEFEGARFSVRAVPKDGGDYQTNYKPPCGILPKEIISKAHPSSSLKLYSKLSDS